MTCQQFRELGERFMQLTRGERAPLFNHLASCSACCRWVKEAKMSEADVAFGRNLAREDFDDPEFRGVIMEDS